jgi:hypothetical protein
MPSSSEAALLLSIPENEMASTCMELAMSMILSYTTFRTVYLSVAALDPTSYVRATSLLVLQIIRNWKV